MLKYFPAAAKPKLAHMQERLKQEKYNQSEMALLTSGRLNPNEYRKLYLCGR